MEKNLQIAGMHCASCAAGIESYLVSREGVEKADIDYAAGEAVIEATEEADVDDIVHHLEAIGYGVERK